MVMYERNKVNDHMIKTVNIVMIERMMIIMMIIIRMIRRTRMIAVAN